MYTSFRIQNFRCFEDLQLEELARVNLIAGKNNTGKTSVLEAIYLNSGKIPQEVLLRIHNRKAKEQLTTSAAPVLPDWKIMFRNLDISQKITLSGQLEMDGTRNNGHQSLETTFEKVRFSLREYQEAFSKSGLEPPHVPREFQTSPTLKVTFRGESFYAFQFSGQTYHYGLPSPLFLIEYLPSYTLIDLDLQATWLTTLKRNRQEALLLETLRIIEPSLDDIELLYDGEPPLIHGYIGLQEPLPLVAMGEGIGRFASQLLAIGNASGGVVCIDEIENGLHYSVLTDVWRAIYKAAVEFDVQIFATTHSFEMINAAHKAFSEKSSEAFRLHRLDRNKSGEIKVVTYDEESLDSSLESNLEVR